MSGNGNSKTVAVAMSGGVDSSVAAALLMQQGYRVIGLTMRLWDASEDSASLGVVRGCCSMESVTQAQRVCDALKVPHYVMDMRHEFRRLVVDDFVSEYLKGRTPNPCIRCNTFIKWQSLWNKARGLDSDYLATGHYAKIVNDENGWHLYRADYRAKDQSYALWGIPRAQLPNTLFPLGDKRKSEVRQIARDLSLGNAETPESQDICFLFGDRYREFLRENFPEQFAKLSGGKILDEAGATLGLHDGFANYTVGQRKGLGISSPERLYVLKTEPETNSVVVGPASSLEVKGLEATHPNWLTENAPDNPFHATIQVRYRDQGVPGEVYPSNDEVYVRFDNTHHGIAPGQSVVFYDGNRLVGGAVIDSAIQKDFLPN
jgi:tRNA-specific 2-thiouridylase